MISGRAAGPPKVVEVVGGVPLTMSEVGLNSGLHQKFGNLVISNRKQKKGKPTILVSFHGKIGSVPDNSSLLSYRLTGLFLGL